MSASTISQRILTVCKAVLMLTMLAVQFALPAMAQEESEDNAPELVGLTIDTPIVDTTNGPATVEWTVAVTDDLSGFVPNFQSIVPEKSERRHWYRFRRKRLLTGDWYTNQRFLST